MKIALLSDIHGFLPEIDKNSVDCVLVAGDICPDFANIYRQLTWLQFGFYPWADQFKEIKFIGGNHDFYLDIQGSNNKDYLMNSHATIGGNMSVYGFPYTICHRWAFHREDEEIQKLLELGLTNGKNLDIMLCHNPPFGICDRIDSFGHIGSKSILNFIEITKPKFCIFGHIHEGYGIYRYYDTLCINCAFVDKRRVPRMQYLILDTDTQDINVVPCKEWKYD